MIHSFWSLCCSYRVGLFVAVSLLCLGTYLGGWAIASGHIFVIIAIFVALLTYRKEHDRFLIRSFRASNIWLFVFLASCLVSLILAWDKYPQPWTDFKKLRHEFLPLLALVVFPIRKALIEDRQSFINIGLVCLGISLSVATVSGLIGHFTGYNPLLRGADPQPGRMGGVYSQVMTYAYGAQFSVLLLVSIGFILIGGLASLKSSGIKKQSSKIALQFLLILLLLLGLVGLYYSYTRGAVLGLVVGSIGLLFAAKAYKTLAVCGVVGLVGCFFLFQSDSAFIKNRAHSDYQRLSQWRAAALVFLDHPMTGIGYRQVEKRIDTIKKDYGLPKDKGVGRNRKIRKIWSRGHSHNNYLEAFAGMGIVGGLSFFGFSIYWLRETWQSKWGRYLFFPPALAFMASGIFENTFFDGEVVTILMLLYVASQIAIDVEQQELDLVE